MIKKVKILESQNLINRITIIMTTHKLKQKEFAKYLGVSFQHISGVIKGKSNASDILLNLICERFNINYEWLITGNGNMFKDNNIDRFSIVLNLLKQLNEKHQDFIIRTLKDLVETEKQPDK